MHNVLKTTAKRFLGRGVRKSYAQFGEDAAINALLKKKKRGIYVDVGAYHPIQYSNTYALYMQKWSGVVIDPNVKLRRLYSLFRPRDTFIEAAVGGVRGDRDYFEYEDEAYNTLDADQVERVKTERSLIPLRSRKIPVLPLSEIIHTERVSSIDFMNVDVEGLDLEVLNTHDWSVRPSIIAVEDHAFSFRSPYASALVAYLDEKGYALESKVGATLVFKDTQQL